MVASSLAEAARRRTQEADQRRREADLAAELARLLLRGEDLRTVLPAAAQRLAQALSVPSAAIELRPVEGDERRVAFPLREGTRQIGTLLLPSDLPETSLRRAQERVVPQLEALLAAAQERDELLGDVVETRALRRSDIIKTALLRSVSHDLRTPITAIVTAAEPLASEHVDDEDRRELARGIQVEARRLSKLIENLLDLSRLEADAAEPRPESCSIDEVLEASIDDLALPGETFNVSIQGDLPLVRADSAQLERAFANLLENAARHSGGHPVSLRARAVGQRVVVRVVDRGPGIPSAQRARVFEPFYRSGHRAVRSSRLGPRPGHRAGLRRGERGDDRGRVPSGAGHDVRGRVPDGAGAGVRRMSAPRRRVLVVDDEPQILRALRVVLRDAGFEAMPASTAQEALDLAALHPPDAAIVDLVLPDGDGIEVTRTLREWTKAPIIVLSAMGEEEQKVRALEAGADDYVTKPFGPRELVARLAATLRRAAPEPGEPVLRAEGLELDLAAHTVRVEGEEVHLTPIEFGLLTALMTNRGRLLTHKALLVEVWGPAYADDTATLRTHIANLRRKIEPGGSRRFIRTDPGVGYRFAV